MVLTAFSIAAFVLSTQAISSALYSGWDEEESEQQPATKRPSTVSSSSFVLPSYRLLRWPESDPISTSAPPPCLPSRRVPFAVSCISRRSVTSRESSPTHQPRRPVLPDRSLSLVPLLLRHHFPLLLAFLVYGSSPPSTRPTTGGLSSDWSLCMPSSTQRARRARSW